jgi:hypothetical protein
MLGAKNQGCMVYHGIAHALKYQQTNMLDKLLDMLGSREGSVVLHVADPQAHNEMSKQTRSSKNHRKPSGHAKPLQISISNLE